MVQAMRTVPLFSDRSRPVQVLTAGVIPALFGAVTGLMLGVSSTGYWVLNLLALIGGVLAGLEHEDGWKGADRGLLGGTLFGTFLLLAHLAVGTDAKVTLPDIQPVLVVFTAIIGMFAGALGGRLRRVVVKPPQPPEAPASGVGAGPAT
jgi:hypothetical protein